MIDVKKLRKNLDSAMAACAKADPNSPQERMHERRIDTLVAAIKSANMYNRGYRAAMRNAKKGAPR